jgi:uncharacterized protein YndB with AHSA1/START domain
MDARSERGTAAAKNPTKAERKSDRELVVSRIINGPARIVFEAWTKPELLQRWWIPEGAPMKLVSFEADVRVGGSYRVVFNFQGSELAFFGTYREVTPYSRLVWTNDEAGDQGQVSTVTFEEKAGKTLVVMHELYPTKEAADAALASGSQEGAVAQFEQLDAFVIAQVASAS